MMPGTRVGGRAPPRVAGLVPTVTGAALMLLVLLLLIAGVAHGLRAPIVEDVMDEFDEFMSVQQQLQQQRPHDPSSAPEAAAGGGRAAAAGNQPSPPPPPPMRIFTYELCMVQLVLWFIFNWWKGRGENERIKDAWLAEFRSLLDEQFAYLGPGCVGGEESPKGSDPFFKEAPDSFLLWASGRRHVKGGMALSLKLRARHDVFRKMWEFALPSEDTLTMEAALLPEEVEPLIFALSRRLHHRSLKLTTPDLFHYTELQPDKVPKNLGLDPEKFVVYTDAPAAAAQLLTPALVKTVVAHQPLFQLLHVTDQCLTPLPGQGATPKAAIRFKFTLPPILGDRGKGHSMTELRPLVVLAFELVDLLCSGKFKLSAAAKAQSGQVRKAIEAREARQLERVRKLELEARRQEKLQQEKDAYNKLNPEQRLKRDLKDERRQQKKKDAGRFKVVR